MQTPAFHFLLSALLLGGCLRANHAVVDADYTTQTLPAACTSFAFVTPDGPQPDTTRLAQVLRAAISAQLVCRGYRYEAHRPHMLIAFKVFAGPLLMRGLHQPDLRSGADWFNSAGVIRVKSSRHRLSDGALLIQLIEQRSHQMVWQGYASSFGTLPLAGQERRAKWYVRQILDQYPLLAPDFLLSRRR